jgi:integrase
MQLALLTGQRQGDIIRFRWADWQRVRIKWERSGGRPLHFHDIRALAATKCPTLEMAQQLLGHSNPAMTRRVYRRGVERVKPLQLIASNQQM